MITTPLVGSFVFIPQGNGILCSVYMNTGHSEPYPETSKRIGNREEESVISDVFDGRYRTIWLEKDDEDSTMLDIIAKTDGSYDLVWYTEKGNVYTGIGFVRNGELIGAYWAV